jgi:hypothetical protein
MKKLTIFSLLSGFLLGNMAYPLWTGYLSAELILGDRTFPALRIWDFADRIINGRLFVSNTAESAGDTPSFFYTYVPAGVSGAHSPIGAAIRSEGEVEAVGAYFYSETEGRGLAFGANSHAATYSGSPAIGLEVNGLNLSENSSAAVRGIDIVNGGNAATQWALGIETSVSQPAGKPKIGIILAGSAHGYPHAPASDTGIVIDHIDSGEAIRIQAGDHVSFNNEGTIYMKYNPQTNQIEFYNAGQLKFAIPM